MHWNIRIFLTYFFQQNYQQIKLLIFIIYTWLFIYLEQKQIDIKANVRQ